jgi:uncharacterized FlaG/YvyC family protein
VPAAIRGFPCHSSFFGIVPIICLREDETHKEVIKVSIDAVGMGGITPVAATTLVAPAAPEAAPRQAQAVVSGAAGDDQDLQQMIDQIQSHIKMMNVSLEFSTYGDHGEKISVVVADKETGEVIREIPAKEIQNLYAKMSELAGMIFNIQI